MKRNNCNDKKESWNVRFNYFPTSNPLKRNYIVVFLQGKKVKLFFPKMDDELIFQDSNTF